MRVTHQTHRSQRKLKLKPVNKVGSSFVLKKPCMELKHALFVLNQTVFLKSF